MVCKLKNSTALGIYTGALFVALPGIAAYLFYKSRLNWQCLGYVPATTNDAPVAWVHAVSVGEAAAAAGLIDILRQYNFQLVLTHTTVAGGEWLRAHHGQYARICQLPLDLPGAVNRFLRRIRPQMAIIMEAEYWPNLLLRARAAGVVLLLANARLSKKSARRHARFSALMRNMATAYTHIAAQTRADARRLSIFGAHATVTGNLKFDRPINATQSRQGAQWRQQWQTPKTILLIAGSRPGEEALLLREMNADFYARYFVMIAPRHPHRGDEIATLLRQQNLMFSRRTKGDAPAPDTTAVYVADTLGEMDAFYACCDAAIIGGSFLPFGGQNPIEAMNAGIPAIIGPHADNYRALVADAIRQNALQQATNAADAIQQLQTLTAAAMHQQSQAAKNLCKNHQGALQRHADIIAILRANA